MEATNKRDDSFERNFLKRVKRDFGLAILQQADDKKNKQDLNQINRGFSILFPTFHGI